MADDNTAKNNATEDEAVKSKPIEGEMTDDKTTENGTKEEKANGAEEIEAADGYYGENDDHDSDLDLSFLKDNDEKGAEKDEP
jgi:hypothetical protein